MKRLTAIVHGRVQGVGYRDFVATEARRLHLVGWVRNVADGDVEVLAEGEDTALAHLVLMLEKGPAPARVDEVTTTLGVPSGEFPDFRVYA